MYGRVQSKQIGTAALQRDRNTEKCSRGNEYYTQTIICLSASTFLTELRGKGKTSQNTRSFPRRTLLNRFLRRNWTWNTFSLTRKQPKGQAEKDEESLTNNKTTVTYEMHAYACFHDLPASEYVKIRPCGGKKGVVHLYLISCYLYLSLEN